MSVDSKAIIRKGVKIEEIHEVLSKKYEDVKVHASQPDFMFIIFKDEGHTRQLAVSYTGSCLRENGIDGVWLSLGMWGNSVDILRHLCETFGGYLDENDCDDDGFYPINFHLYVNGSEFTEMDLFINKVISKLGYDNLKPAMELFNEFKNIQ